jgi:hypothetical protein
MHRFLLLRGLQAMLREAFGKLNQVKANFTSVRISAMEDFIGRGDRRLGDVIRWACMLWCRCAMSSKSGIFSGSPSKACEQLVQFLHVTSSIDSPSCMHPRSRAWELGATNDAWWESEEAAFAAWSRAIEESGLGWKYRQVCIGFFLVFFMGWHSHGCLSACATVGGRNLK